MKTVLGILATYGLSLSIVVPAMTLSAINAEAQFYRGDDAAHDAEVRRGLARRAATSQSPEARRYRAKRRAEIHHDRRYNDRHAIRRDRHCETVHRAGRNFRVCPD